MKVVPGMGKPSLLLPLGALLGLVLIAAFLFGLASPGTRQPLPFNHQVHKDNDLDCEDCHQLYKEHSASGRPSLETCAGCHSEPLGESEAEKALQGYILKSEEIPWTRLYRLPEDVYFSHRSHAVLGKVECQTCHGDIGLSSAPPSQPLKISMKKCMKCHEERNVTNDCISCHR